MAEENAAQLDIDLDAEDDDRGSSEDEASMMTAAPTRTRTELVARHIHTCGRGARAEIDEAGWGRGGASRRMAKTESRRDACGWNRRG